VLEAFVSGLVVTLERFDRLRARAPRGAPSAGGASRTRGSALWLFVAVAIGAFGGGLLLGPLETAWFHYRIHALMGDAMTFASANGSGDDWTLQDVRVRRRSGAIWLAADRVRLTQRAGVAHVELVRPQFTFATADNDAAERSAFASSLQKHEVEAAIEEGALSVATVRFQHIDGTLRFGSAGLAVDAAMRLDDGSADGEPVTMTSTTADDGTLVQTWTAPELSLAALGPLLPETSGMQITGGFLRGLHVAIGGGALDGGARVEGLTGMLAGTHRLSGVHGALSLSGGGLGTPRIVGLLDAAPFEIAGEVHDLHARTRWLFDGSNDLRSFARLFTSIAAQPQLQSLRVEATAPGIQYGEYSASTENGPIAVSLLYVDPHEPTVRFDTAIAGDSIVSGGERTSALGVRTGAVGGVNGDYFDIGRSYEPQGMLMRGGQLLRGPTDRAALIVDRTNAVHFGEFKLRGTLRAGGESYPVTQLNNWPAGDVTVITPDFGKTLPAGPGVTFAALAPLGGAHFRVGAIQPMHDPLPVTFGIAYGGLVHPQMHVGQVVALSYKLEPEVPGAVAGIGGGPLLLRDGQWVEDPHAPAPDEHDVRWPVIALGRQSDDHLLFAAVDGRHPERSIGMTRPDFGALLQRFGCVDAMALDSGGSVTLVARAPGEAAVSVRNHPSDSSEERWVSDALFVYSSAPAPTIVPPREAPPTP
jgi:exopolysaccharide biosynthesis protein